jgi:hypothetical protein
MPILPVVSSDDGYDKYHRGQEGLEKRVLVRQLSKLNSKQYRSSLVVKYGPGGII